MFFSRWDSVEDLYQQKAASIALKIGISTNSYYEEQESLAMLR